MSESTETEDASFPAFSLLDRLGIVYQTVTHAALHKVADSQALRGEIEGGHTKNLFLKDKSGQFFLITAEENSPLDLKTLDKAIGAKGRLTFAREEQLLACLGVLPGSVSPLALVQDIEKRVTFVLEKKLTPYEKINVHPLVNTRTTTLFLVDLLIYCRATGHEALILELPWRKLDADNKA